MADQNGVALVENFHFEQSPLFHAVYAAIKGKKYGELGKLKHVDIKFGFRLAESDTRFRSDLAGGALNDIGVYAIRAFRSLLGNIEFLSGEVFGGGGRVDIGGMINIVSPKCSVTGSASFGFERYYDCSLQAWFDNGRIQASRFFTMPFDSYGVIKIESGCASSFGVSLPRFDQWGAMFHAFEAAMVNADLQLKYRQELLQQSLDLVRVKNLVSRNLVSRDRLK